MLEAISKANGRRLKIRSAMERAFIRQKGKMKFFIRTIGICGVKAKIGATSIVYNTLRYVSPKGKRAIT
jgi:hypothetical protein